MSEIFLTIVNMSISASWIVLAVLLLRLLFKKAPKWITVLLWGIVAVRLICPFTIESVMCLIPSAETISPDIMTDSSPQINTGIPVINNAVNPIINGTLSPDHATSANPLQVWIPILSAIWIVGMVLLLAYMAISFWRVKRKIGTAVILRDNIYQSETVVSPFLLGIIKPKIYLPFSISEQDMEHVIAHEMAHIRRKDHWWKPFGFLLLTLHWFNPLMWLGYVLLCRDIELACDEKVVKEMNTEKRADYSQALLSCSVNRRMISACPIAFGEVGVKNRVKSVLNYKKPAFWIIIVALVASISIAICFLTNPKTTSPEVEEYILSDIANIHTDYEGVYMLVESIVNGPTGDKEINVIWYNETSQNVAIPSDFKIKFKDGDEWIDLKPGVDFGGRIYSLSAYSTMDKYYPMHAFGILKDGRYRLNGTVLNDNGDENNVWVEFDVVDEEIIVSELDEFSKVAIPDKIAMLKAKFPMYFNLDTRKGLDLYIWKLGPTSYWCGLLSVKNPLYKKDELRKLGRAPVQIDDMRSIIDHYISNGKVTKDDITIHLIEMGYSSYRYTEEDFDMQELSDLFWKENKYDENLPLVEKLKYAYPSYFDLDTSNGLDIYFFALAKNGYYCFLIPSSDTEYRGDDLWRAGAPHIDMYYMREIIDYYISNGKITKDDVTFKYTWVTWSSYIGPGYTSEYYEKTFSDLFWKE